MTKTNGASYDNDAKACYNRIGMSLASLCSQCLGMSARACQLLVTTLREAHYHVKTQLGVSNEYYTTTESSTVHGFGQGGQESPSIWAIISDIIMKCLGEKLEGAILCDSKQLLRVKQIFTGFVNDTTLWVNTPFQSNLHSYIQSIDALLQQTETTAQWWEELLHSTGGKLELPKCFYYTI